MLVHTMRLRRRSDRRRSRPRRGGLWLVTGAVEASAAWARTSPAMADSGAAYMVLTSDDAVTLVSVSVPAEVPDGPRSTRSSPSATRWTTP